MLQVPEKLLEKYRLLLRQNAVPANSQNSYIKWLRFYLDFCRKYRHAYADRGSLTLFIKKLQDKNQSPHQQAQARKAIEIYYSGLASRQQPLLKPGDHVKDTVEPYRAGENASPWDSALELLGNEIKLRHYSAKTFNSYTLWAKNSGYIQNKNSRTHYHLKMSKSF